ncbi:MAG: DUF2914 domain-containing protein [Candidatus Uhrbacteria bacterium]|nr:DUF2914 domain-containing protein [Candidatus Uhrbacteria bacterium]
MPLKAVKKFFEKYERVLLPLMLLFGVTTDYIAFKAINTQWAFAWLGFHLVAALVVIAYVHLYDAKQLPPLTGGGVGRGRITQYLRIAAPLVLQLSFGALLNASFVFYWFSASFSVSWPFFAIVVLLMISNDVFRHLFVKPILQISVFYFACFSILALMIPYLVNSIDPQWFVLAGAIALLIVTLYTFLLSRGLPVIKAVRSKILFITLAIFVVMNSLYFLNLIPPIPLSLREADVYHSIARSGDGYVVQDEDKSFFAQFDPEETLHLLKNDRAYLYSSIFAPAELNTQIFHRWQYFDPTQKKWIDESRYGFYITGGRQAGYRGYSLKVKLEEGRWRVSVETARGQVLGRVRFRVKYVDQLPPLIEEVK